MNHFNISLIKSGVRIGACVLGAAAFRHTDLRAFHAFVFLALAEGLGIFEEYFA